MMPQSENKPRYAEAIQWAQKVWDEMYITSLPLPILEVAAAYGLQVKEVFLNKYFDVSGVIDMSKGLILVNQADSGSHQRFTIAHELGHWLMHRDELNKNPRLAIYYRKPIGGEVDPLEKEANCFAAHLLVPNDQLKKYSFLSSDSELASLFAVSRQVIGYRKKHL